MIYKDKTNEEIENVKARLGIKGDVYIVGDFIETLESHKILIPTSEATTIEEAEQERFAWEEEQRRLQEAATQQSEEEPSPEKQS